MDTFNPNVFAGCLEAMSRELTRLPSFLQDPLLKSYCNACQLKAQATACAEWLQLHAGIALRVPTPNVSVVDLVLQVEKKTFAEEVNEAFPRVRQGPHGRHPGHHRRAPGE